MVYPALLPLMRKPRLPVVDWTDAPVDLNGLVRFAERRSLVFARVPSHFKRSLLTHTATAADSGGGGSMNRESRARIFASSNNVFTADVNCIAGRIADKDLQRITIPCCIIFFFGCFYGVWILRADVSEHWSSIFDVSEHCQFHLRKWRWNWNWQCSETSVYKIQTPGNHPKERIQHSEQQKFEAKNNNSCLLIFLSYLTLRWLMSYIYIWSTHSWCF